MSKKRWHKTETVVFTDPRQVVRIKLRAGHCFVMLCRGHPVSPMPLNEPGQYDVSAEMLPGGRYPYIVTAIDLAHVPAWVAMSQAMVDGIVDQCEAAAKRGMH